MAAKGHPIHNTGKTSRRHRLQRLDNSRCPTIEMIEGSLKHVSVRMNPEEIAWWENFIRGERKRRREWEELTDDEYQAAGVHFDLQAMQHLNPVLANNEQNDEVYKKREKELKELIDEQFSTSKYTKAKIPFFS